MVKGADGTAINSRTHGNPQVLVSRESHGSSSYVGENALPRCAEDGGVVKGVYMRGLRRGSGSRKVVGLKVGDSLR